MLNILKKIIPKPIFQFFQPAYHYLLAVAGVLLYRFPSRKILVVGVTGTKGKTTTVELLNAMFEAAGIKTALLSTLRFKIGEEDTRNMYKMTMPGRLFTQKFLREAVDQNCQAAIIEMTSEGAKQFRHKFINIDALLFTNLAPEHIESHGSYENYLKAKLSIAQELEKSFARKVWPSQSEEIRGLFEKNFSPVLVANTDDKEGEKFLALNIPNKIPYSLSNAFNVHTDESGSSFQVDKTVFYMKLPGIFNISNTLAVIACGKHFGIPMEIIKKGLELVERVRGRMEKIEVTGLPAGRQDFDVVVDYAHTPDSLRAVYEVYNPSTGSGQAHKLICVLGNTGGGRDKWKRPEMGKIADEYCSEIILTNEDPYDEDPMQILEEIKSGIKTKPTQIIIDRREAIKTAITKAGAGDVVLITGKGTDPYIMGPKGSKTPWDDATVAREELGRLFL